LTGGTAEEVDRLDELDEGAGVWKLPPPSPPEPADATLGAGETIVIVLGPVDPDESPPDPSFAVALATGAGALGTTTTRSRGELASLLPTSEPTNVPKESMPKIATAAARGLLNRLSSHSSKRRNSRAPFS
jgi:hypothetical protein